MIIAEYTLNQPFLRQTLNRVPMTEIAWDDSFMTPDDRERVIVWADCDDFAALDAALNDDPTVSNQKILMEVGGRRLYRLDLDGDAAESSIMPLMIDVGGVLQRATASQEGWWNRCRYPNREAFHRVYRLCQELELDFTFHRIYEESALMGPETSELSDLQRETLIEAVDSGYLDIPRRLSLEELGERLGISRNAASERFRRGVKSLIEQTIYSDAEREAS